MMDPSRSSSVSGSTTLSGMMSQSSRSTPVSVPSVTNPELYTLIHDLIALHPHRSVAREPDQVEIFDNLQTNIISSIEELLVSEDFLRSAKQLETSEKRLLAKIDAMETEKKLKTLREAKDRATEAMDNYVATLENCAKAEQTGKMFAEEAHDAKMRAEHSLAERTKEFEDLKRLLA